MCVCVCVRVCACVCECVCVYDYYYYITAIYSSTCFVHIKFYCSIITCVHTKSTVKLLQNDFNPI